MPSEAPLATLATEGVRAYFGYRGPSGVTVRRPSGASERFSAGAAPAALAEEVLGDRLGRAPSPALVEAFSRQWVEPRARGEFVWPVVALDEWLAAQNADEAPRAATPSTRALRRTLAGTSTALQRFHAAVHPHQSLSPRGGH